jgi:hypothetical protein
MKTNISDIKQDQSTTEKISESDSNNDISEKSVESTDKTFAVSDIQSEENTTSPAGSELDIEIVDESDIAVADRADTEAVIAKGEGVDAIAEKPTKRPGFILGALVGMVIALVLLSAPAYIGYNTSVIQQTELANVAAILQSTNFDYQALKVEVTESKLADLQQQLLEMEQQEKVLTNLLARRADVLLQRDEVQGQLDILTAQTQTLSVAIEGQNIEVTQQSAVDEGQQPVAEKVRQYWGQVKQKVTEGWEAIIDKLPKDWF